MPAGLPLLVPGSLRAAFDRVDWAATAIGPVDRWSATMRHTVELALQTRFPISLFWGPELVMIYNDAYVELIADKHPGALGAPAAEIFPEAWDAVGPMMHGVLAGDGATWEQDSRVPLQRHGRLEEAYFTFSYSPIRDAEGRITGMMNIATETTQQVIGRRRLGLLGRLREQLRDVTDLEQLADSALPLLRANAADFAAVDLRLDGVGSSDARLPAAPASAPDGNEVLVEHTDAGHVAWLPVTAPAAGIADGRLVVLLSPGLAPDEGYLGFLRLIASSLTQALGRMRTRAAERSAAEAQARVSEALQRNLLSAPLDAAGLQIAARYRPAARLAQIGGDWYDSFRLPDGSLTLVIGDVAGHDGQAAAGMAEVRNLLRGVAYTVHASPAGMLTGLELAMHGLRVGVIATAVVAQVDDADPAASTKARTLRWANAGHPPPVLIDADGSTQLLERDPDPLLGIGPPGRDRGDHHVVLAPGAAVVLYTDGLIERRSASLDDGLDWLLAATRDTQDLNAEALCDHLTGQLDGPLDDDLALLVLRVQAAG